MRGTYINDLIAIWRSTVARCQAGGALAPYTPRHHSNFDIGWLLPGTPCRRHLHAGASCQSEPSDKRPGRGLEAPAFKQNMRQLLKKVHPDRFQNHPDAQKANDASLKTLQTYMRELRGEGGQPGYPYQFEFHLHADAVGAEPSEAARELTPAQDAFRRDPRNRDQQGDPRDALRRDSESAGPPRERLDAESDAGRRSAAASTSGADELRRVRIRLPAPGPGSGERLPRGARLALGRLFVSCGLDNIFQDDDDLTSGLNADQLRHFLPDAVELARQGEAAHFSMPAQQVAAMRSAFSFAKKVKIVFDEEASRLPPVRQGQLLEALAKAFDQAATANVSSCTVVIGEGVGVDGLGRLWLRHDDDVDAWRRTLQTADMSAIRHRRALMEDARAAEALLARRLGVDGVFSAQRFALTAPYMECLQRLAAVAESIGPVCNGSLRGVYLCVLPVTEQPEIEHVKSTGVVKLHSQAHALDLYDYIAMHGREIMRNFQAAAAVDRESRQLGHHVEQQLRLRRLLRDPSLSHEDFKSGCYRLLRHRDVIVETAAGSAIRLTHRNGIQPGDNVVDIAWNFDL